ncbi:MAG: energy transducer TonB [Gemmatimonadota bacterium]
MPGFEGQAARYVLSVQYDTAGAVTDVYSVDSTLAPEREVELMDAIYANLRTDVEDIRGVRVGMFGGPNPELAVGPIHECRPLLLNRDLVLRMLTRDVEKANLRGAAELWIRVAANGLPLEWRFAKHSGSQGMDAAAYNAVVRMRFLPARIDGVPRAVWVSIPIGTSG